MYVHKRRQLRFKNLWLTEPELEPIVVESWEENGSDPFLRKLYRCTEKLDVGAGSCVGGSKIASSSVKKEWRSFAACNLMMLIWNS